jgi:hypothetical protein
LFLKIKFSEIISTSYLLLHNECSPVSACFTIW